MSNYEIVKEIFPYLSIIKSGEKEILFFDLKGIGPAESLERVRNAGQIVTSQPENSVLILTDFTDLIYDKESMEAIKIFAKNNKPFVIKSAILGITGLKKIAYSTVVAFSGRTNLKIFDQKETAIDWLVE